MDIIKEKDCFYIENEGNKIGEITYYLKEGRIIIDHTYVNPDFRGHGLARKLVDAVVNKARAENLMIEPHCSYAVKVLFEEKYSDILFKK